MMIFFTLLTSLVEEERPNVLKHFVYKLASFKRFVLQLLES